MPLDPVKLDDLRWKDMVEAIRRRIPAASDGQWTLHAPVDPGVTLLELFAWLLEQRVYWMDQVPAPMVRAALALLDEAPARTQCAVTVMQLGPQPARPFRRVPRLTQLDLKGTLPLTFSTERALVVLPVASMQPDTLRVRVGLHVAGEERTNTLEAGEPVELFPANGSSAEVRLELPLTVKVPNPAPEGAFSLLFELATPPGAALSPQWKPDAPRLVPPPAGISWWYRNAPGARPVAFAHVNDGTRGFRRTGLVRFDMPRDWCPEPAAANAAPRYAIWVRVERATFPFPPALVRVVPNAVIARHRRRTQVHGLPLRWLPIPGNSIPLQDFASATAGSALEAQDMPPLETGVRLRMRERDPHVPGKSRWHLWKATSDLYRHGPADRVFVVDRTRGEFRFGDGLTGRVPLPVALDDDGDENVCLRYWVGGGGGAGLVGAAREWIGQDDLEARNVVAADGGAESETVDAARPRAAAAVRQLTRAITADDYEALATGTPGVGIARAHAAIGYHPAHPCTPVPGALTVFLVPHAPREADDEDAGNRTFVAAPTPDPGALAAVSVRLDAMRMLTTELFVRPARFRAVALRVSAESGAGAALEVERSLTNHLRRFLDPLAGGDEREGWPFGEPLRPSVLLREAQKALGESGTVREVAIGLDGAEPNEACREVNIGAHDLVRLERVSVRLTRSHRAAGGLR